MPLVLAWRNNALSETLAADASQQLRLVEGAQHGDQDRAFAGLLVILAHLSPIHGRADPEKAGLLPDGWKAPGLNIRAGAAVA